MNASRGTLAALAGLITLLWVPFTHAAEPQLAALNTFSTPGYTLFAQRETQARDVAANLEVIERVLTRLVELDTHAKDNPAIVILLPRADWRRYLRTDPKRRPDLMPDASATYLLLPSDVGSARLRSAVFHQGAHLFLRRHFDATFPLWFDEGFALLAQGTRIDGGQAIVGAQHYSNPRPETTTHRDTELDRAARSLTEDANEWTPLDRLLRAREVTDPVKRGAWAMLHKGLIAEPGFGKQLFAYVQAINEQHSVEAAVQRSFGMNLSELERVVRRYAERRDFPESKFEFSLPAPVTLVAGAALSADETLALVSRAAEDSPEL